MDKNDLLKGSLVLLLLTNAFNLLNLLFQVFVAHKLSLESYGIFTALFSIIYVFGIFSESIQLVMTKKVARLSSKAKVDSLFLSSMKSSALVSIAFFVIYLVILLFANIALDIPLPLILLNGVIILFALTSPVVRGILQGQRRFLDLGVNIVMEGGIKFVVGVLFMLLGWEIYGTFGAVIISMAIPIIYGAFKQIRPSRNAVKEKVSLFSVFKLDVIVMMTCITLFFMLDTFLARAVLSPIDAGYYSIASTIAKMAFLGTQPISRAMLSHVAAAKSKEQIKSIFRRSMHMLLILLGIGLVIALVFSDLLVFLFSGAGKEAASSILGIIFVAICIISVTNLFIFYRIAADRTRNYGWLIAFVAVLVLLLLMAPSTLIGFAVSYLLATIIFLIGSLLVLRW